MCSPADEAQHAALDVLARELGDADHMARLDAMWRGETRLARQEAWRAAIRTALPPAYRGARLDGGTATWLWRTLRSVEAAGLDAAQVAAAAVRAAPLTGARDVAADDRCQDPDRNEAAHPRAMAAVVFEGAGAGRPGPAAVRGRARGGDGRPPGPHRRAPLSKPPAGAMPGAAMEHQRIQGMTLG